ncbi:MAG: hypothetical protein H0U76_08645 [Ktedonobacteraceae bacterium]|nr:hypothetical protein [Ktedonobacteraceae bacterium]
MRKYRILLVGLGKLGSQIFDLLVRLPGNHAFLAGGRDVEHLRQRTHLSLFAAMQLGHMPDVACTYMDVWNIEQTAEIIARCQPDLIVCAATLARWGTTPTLPQTVGDRLTAAQMGPRLPLHLTLVYKLMQAVRATGHPITVINAIYPDVVNPVLAQVGLAPLTGIGDLANNVPAVRKSIAVKLHRPIEHVDVRLVMARYISYWMSRKSVENTPFYYTALVHGKDVTHLLERETIFDLLPTTLKRPGGETGLMMTAASAASVVNGIVNNTETMTHAPGPNGLPGGYPIKVGREGIEIVLPQNLSREEAIQINEAGLRLDGIEKIEHDGTVSFTEENMAILKDTLGYDCRRMPLADVEEQARELRIKYLACANKYQ